MNIHEQRHKEVPDFDRERSAQRPTRGHTTSSWVLLIFSLLLLLSACSKPNRSNMTTASGTATTAANVSADHARVSRTDSSPATPGQRGPNTVDTTELHPSITAAHNRFGFLIFNVLTRDATVADNVFLSPLSISLALSMVYNGAAGETAEALAETLQFTDLDLHAVNKAHRTLLDAFNSADREQLGVHLHVANSLWHRQEFTLRPEFLQQTATSYRATASGLDFSAPESVHVINDWVSRQTEGLIDKLIDKLEDDLALLLINTVYFNGKWTVPFDPALTKDGSFRLASGEDRIVPMMYLDGRFDHFADPDFEAVRLPYGDDERLAMYVFLPSEESGLAAFLERLTYSNWNEWLAGFSRKLGEVTLPRLRIEYKTKLNDVLQSLGMGIAFDRMRADFSNMTPEGSPTRLSLSDVVHQSVLKVDEEGTEAAAATSIGVRVTSLPLYEFRLTADRPFFVAIRDDDTGELLFIGAIVDPS